MAETGWNKTWPIVTGYYWRRINERDSPSLVRIIGDTCRFTDGSSEGRHECYEFLGPLTAADFEQLTRLRKLAEDSERVLNKIGRGVEGMERRARELADALREALAQRNTGGK